MLDAQLEQPTQIVPAILAPQDGLQRRSHLGIRRIALEHLFVQRYGLFGAAQLLGEDAGQAQLEQASLGARRWAGGGRRWLGLGIALLLLLALLRRWPALVPR